MSLKAMMLWIRDSWDRFLLYAALLALLLLMRGFHADLAGFSRSIQEDTQFLQMPPRFLPLIDEAWVNSLIARAQSGDAVAATRDLFSLVREAKPAAPQPAESEEKLPARGAERFSLVKIYREPVRLLLKGYIQLRDGSYSLQINWAGQTDFRQVGESIRGYVIEHFEKLLVPQQVQGNVTQDMDQSYVIIHKNGGEPLRLQKGHLVTEKELFAKLFDHNANQVAVVHVSSQIDTYKVVDINEDEIILSDEAGKQITLTRDRERN